MPIKLLSLPCSTFRPLWLTLKTYTSLLLCNRIPQGSYFINMPMSHQLVWNCSSILLSILVAFVLPLLIDHSFISIKAFLTSATIQSHFHPHHTCITVPHQQGTSQLFQSFLDWSILDSPSVSQPPLYFVRCIWSVPYRLRGGFGFNRWPSINFKFVRQLPFRPVSLWCVHQRLRLLHSGREFRLRFGMDVENQYLFLSHGLVRDNEDGSFWQYRCSNTLRM